MRYILIRFTFGLECLAYQVVDQTGVLVKYVDEDGQDLELPGVTESEVIDDSPAIKDWME